MTWASERCIEVPIAHEYLREFASGTTLEVGNVLSHYGVIRHQVLDKFEKGPGIINADIVEFHPTERFDLVLSISTFEHIGFDDESPEGSGKKILSAIASCRKLLKPTGKMVMTVPIGYNPDLDQMIAQNALGTAEEIYYKKIQRFKWVPSSKTEALACDYKHPFPYANAILVAEFARETAPA
ncbi:MAG: class I SAM-dependent methyltransferase [Verrucomicrobiota bacterium]